MGALVVIRPARADDKGPLADMMYSAGPEKGELYLSNLGVDRERRGRGIGSALVETKRREARAAGFRKLALDVADNNPGAAKLYRRLGFKVVGQKLMAGAVAGCPGYLKMERAL